MNLGGPSLRTCRKRNTDFTTKSGIIKYLSVTRERTLSMYEEGREGFKKFSNNIS